MFDLICEPFRHGNITVFNEIFSNLALFLAHFGPIVLVYLKSVLNGCLFIFFPNIVKT